MIRESIRRALKIQEGEFDKSLISPDRVLQKPFESPHRDILAKHGWQMMDHRVYQHPSIPRQSIVIERDGKWAHWNGIDSTPQHKGSTDDLESHLEKIHGN